MSAKIRNGTKSPGIKLVSKTNKVFPGTLYWYEHPFWTAIRQPRSSLSDTLEHVWALTNIDAISLFCYSDSREASPVNHNDYIRSILSKLQEHSDFDSLTSVIIFIQCLRITSSYSSDYADYLSEIVIRIYIRLAAERPFFMVSNELFEYLNSNFIQLMDNNEWLNVIKMKRIKAFVLFNKAILDTIDSLRLLKHHKRAPAACLHIAERHITPLFFEKIAKSDKQFYIDEVRQFCEIKALKKELSEWETQVGPHEQQCDQPS